MEYQIISGDTHLEIPAQRWTNRIPEKYQDRAPRTIRVSNGGDALLIEGSPAVENAFDLYAGKGREHWGPSGQTYDSTVGTGSAADRLACLDLDGIDAEIIFPSVVTGPRRWRYIRDNEPYLACVRAYNEFIAEEYAGFNPERLMPIGTIPMSTLPDSIAELKYCKEVGLRGVQLSAFPSGKGYPTDEDNTFWEEAQAINMPLTVHVDLDRTGPREGPLVQYAKKAEGAAGATRALQPDIAQQVAKFAQRGAVNAVQMMIAGVFDRYPELRIFMAENQIGWVPTFMTVADERYDRHEYWAQDLLGFKGLPNGTPSDYIKRHILWGFQRDPAGVELRHWIGVHNLIWGSDFPHQESEYPHSKKVLDQNFAGVPADETYKMLCGNAKEFFHLA